VATHYDIVIDKGADLALTFTVRNDGDDTLANLTGYTARLQARPSPESATVYLTLTSSPAAGLALGGAAGTVTLSLTAAQTAALTWAAADYDLFITSAGGVVTRLLYGKMFVRPRVTQ
jgi:hypothetical protein